MCRRSLFNFVVLAFFMVFTFAEYLQNCAVCSNYGFQHSAKSSEKVACNSPQALVSPQARSDQAPLREAAEHLPHFAGPSLQGREFSPLHCRGDDGEHTLEVHALQAAQKAHGSFLPGLSASVATSDGPHIRPHFGTSTTARDRLELRSIQLGPIAAMESGKAALAISNTEVQATLQQCEDTEGTTQRTRQGTWRRHGKRQGCDDTTSAATDTMAWLRHAWTSCTAHAYAAAPTNDAGTLTWHNTDRLQLACNAAATGPAEHHIDSISCTEPRGEGAGRDDQDKADGAATRYEDESSKLCQEGRCQGNERLAYCRPTTGTCETRPGGCLTSSLQLDRILENLPYRCNSYVAGIRDALSTAREGRPNKDTGSAGPVQPGQCPVGPVPDGCRQSQNHRDQGRGRRDCGGASHNLERFRQDPRQFQDALNLPTSTSSSNRADRDRHASCEETTTEYALCGRSIHGAHGGRPGPTERAAFYSGRLSMTYGYDNQGPCHHWALHRTSALIMKWTHRRNYHHHFLSEWQARENAIGLALSLHGPSIPMSSTTSSTLRSSTGILRSSTTRRTRRTCFSSQVEVWIGNCDMLEMYNITVPELCLACGLSPWSTTQHEADPILLKPDPQEAHLPPLPEERAVSSQTTTRRELTNLRELPHWFSQVGISWMRTVKLKTMRKARLSMSTHSTSAMPTISSRIRAGH